MKTLLWKRIPKDIAQLEEYLKLDNKKELLQLAHQLMGTFSYMRVSGTKIVNKLQTNIEFYEVNELQKEADELKLYLRDSLHIIEKI